MMIRFSYIKGPGNRISPYHELRMSISMDFIVYLYWTAPSNCNCSFAVPGWLEIPHNSVELWMFGKLGSSERGPPGPLIYR